MRSAGLQALHPSATPGAAPTARREDGTWWDHDYNNHSEVIWVVKRTADGGLVPGLSFGYRHDEMVNRLTSISGIRAGISSRTHTPNGLDPYFGIVHGGKLNLLTQSMYFTCPIMQSETNNEIPNYY